MSDEDGSVLTGNPEAEDTSESQPAATELTTPEWVSEEYKEVVETKGWKTADDAIKSCVNLEKQVGGDKVLLPKEGEDLSEWEGWKQLGTPETSEGYEFKVPDGMQDYSPEMLEWFAKEAHAANLPVSIAQRLHDGWVQKATETQADHELQQERQREDWNAELKKEYGTAYDDRVGLARRAVRSFGSDELIKVLEQTGLGDHPELIKAFSRIGSELSSGQQFKDAEQSGQFGVTPDMAKEQIAKIRSNPALYDTSHSEHKVLNEKLTQLTEVAYGNEVLFTTGAGN